MTAKQIAAIAAVNEVKDGMTVGLGTGSTAAFAISELGKKIKGSLSIKAVASSTHSEELAKSQGINIIPFQEVNVIDIYIDGADEVDSNCNLIKGGGGALLREKILAYNSQQFIVIVDDSKVVNQLGKFPLPVEVVPFAIELTKKNIEKLGCKTVIRNKDGNLFVTDNGNHIIDCDFGTIADPERTELMIRGIPGVVECGLFLKKMVSKVIVANGKGEMKTFPGSRDLDVSP